MFVACGIWCLADVSSVSPSSEQTEKIFYRINFEIQSLLIRLILLFVDLFLC